MKFLPEDYKSPRATSGYMKIQDGENRVRILSAPIIGWEDWTLDKKPVRFRMADKPAKPIDPKRPIKHFWAFIVWNYMAEKIQVLQINQATIQNTLQTLCADSDWGSPYYYDLKIIRKGEGKDTEYTVTPLPHKVVSEAIKKEFYETRCYLDALFTSDNPFAEWPHYTEGVFEKDDELDIQPEPQKKSGPPLLEMLKKCPQDVQDSVKKFCAKYNLNADLTNLPEHLEERIEKAILRAQPSLMEVA